MDKNRINVGFEGIQNVSVLLNGENCLKNANGSPSLDMSLDSIGESHAESMITGLRAIGMDRWDAIASVVNGGLLGKDQFPELDGVPKKALKQYKTVSDAIGAFDRLSITDKDGANRSLNAYLRGRNVNGTLDLMDIPWLVSLPDGLIVDGALKLNNSSVSMLPNDINAKCGVYLWNCKNLKSISNVRTGSNIWIKDCNSLVSIKNMNIGSGVDISGCGSLKKIGNIVCDNLSIRDCDSLCSIPKNINCRSILITGCRLWDGLVSKDVKAIKIYTEEYPNCIGIDAYRNR